jgi:cytochrome-b5 reductase
MADYLTSCALVLSRGVVDGLEIQRAYTPISPVTAEGYFDVLIKVSQFFF